MAAPDFFCCRIIGTKAERPLPTAFLPVGPSGNIPARRGAAPGTTTASGRLLYPPPLPRETAPSPPPWEGCPLPAALEDCSTPPPWGSCLRREAIGEPAAAGKSTLASEILGKPPAASEFSPDSEILGDPAVAGQRTSRKRSEEGYRIGHSRAGCSETDFRLDLSPPEPTKKRPGPAVGPGRFACAEN